MRTVSVVGHGSAQVIPDTAEIRVAAVHRDTGLSEALAGAESARAGVVATARRYVDAHRVTSTNLNVWPAHDNEGRPAGFEARHSLTIRCDDLALAGTLVTALAADVGHRLQVESVSLVVAEPGDAAGEARERAFADAVARAEHLAGLAGAALGEVQSVVEGGVPSLRMGELDSSAAFSSRLDVSFEPGQTQVSSSLTVTFELVSAG